MNLHSWRKDRDLTLAQFSARSGIPISSLSRIERGKQWPRSHQIKAIYEASEGAVTADDLIAAYRGTPKSLSAGAAAE